MSRMRLRKKIYLNNRFILFIVILLIIYIVFISLNKFSSKSKIYLEKYALKESTLLINKLVNNVVNNIDKEMYNNLTNIKRNSNNEIMDISYNTSNLNNILYSVNNDILDVINNINNNEYDGFLKEEDFIYYIPVGIMYNNSFIYFLSPKIPYKISISTIYDSYINTTIKEYGINNSLCEISINISFNAVIIFPFISKSINIDKNVLLASNLIEGVIPEYYGGAISNNSKIYSND